MRTPSAKYLVLSAIFAKYRNLEENWQIENLNIMLKNYQLSMLLELRPLYAGVVPKVRKSYHNVTAEN